MRKHFSIFMFLFAAAGLAGAARAAVLPRGGYVYYGENGAEKGGVLDSSLVYSAVEGYKDYVAVPPAGRKVGNWGWAQTGVEAMNYNKVKWEDPSETGTEYSLDLEPGGQERVAVRFDYILFDVTFNGNGGTGIMPPMLKMNYDSVFPLPPNKFVKTGYHFNGWKTNLTSDVVFADKAQVKGSVLWNGTGFNSTFYAQWAANTYAVRFDGNGATGGSMDDESFAYDETKALTANAFMKTGFAFAGWATNATEGAVLYKDKASVKNLTTNDNATVTLYARWAAGDYTVTFDANGGGAPSPYSKSVTYGSTYGTLATCSRTGYSLDGWYTEKSGGTKITADTTVAITGAQTLYAHWTPVTYTITYDDVKQGTASNPNPTTYTIESDDIVFQPPSEVPGYKFDKWNPISIPKGSTGDKTARATYLTITYKPDVKSPLTYNGYSQTCALPGNGVTAVGNQATDVGKHTATFRPTSGYCWDDGKVEPYVVVWEIVNARVENAVVTQRGALTYTGEPQQPTVDASAEVKGWQTVTWKYSTSQGDYTETMPSFTDAGTYTVYFEASAPNHEPAYGSFGVTVDRARSAEVTLSSKRLPYTKKEQGPDVTFVHCAESGDSVKRATDVGSYAVKATPDENYAWSNGETAAREFTWSIDDSLYTVQFDGNGGTGEMASTNLAYNEEYVVPECGFTKTGCEFQRWQVLIDNRIVTNYLAGTLVSNLTTVAGKFVTFKAEWLGRYTIAFDKNGGEGEMASTNVERDVGFQLPSNAFTRTGYDFTTWTTNLSASIKPADLIADGATVTNLVAAGEICTLHALWEAHHYTITFRANGGKGTDPANKSCVYGKEYELPTPSYTPPKNYATFVGWSTNKNDTTGVCTLSNLTAVADGIVTLYAVWYYDVGDWSRALDCDNLKFENIGTYPWTIEEGTGALPGSDKWLEQKDLDGTKPGMLYAELDESGTLTYWWKGEGGDPQYPNELLVRLSKTKDEIYPPGDELDSHSLVNDQGWTKSEVHIEVPAGEKRYVWFAHMDSISVGIDCVTWEPDGGGEPTPGDPVEVTAASVTDGVFALTIPTEIGEDYGVWTNADLTIDSWGLMGEPQTGDGNPWKVEWTILPEFPQLFFKAHKVEYK